MNEAPFVRSAVGVVVDGPRRWLGLEALTLLTSALIGYGVVGESWWLLLIFILAPDLAFIGYVGGNRAGAHLYNLAHATPLPGVLLGVGIWQTNHLVEALALIWLAHIGGDRLLGIGLKYSDRPSHTHLGSKG